MIRYTTYGAAQTALALLGGCDKSPSEAQNEARDAQRRADEQAAAARRKADEAVQNAQSKANEEAFNRAVDETTEAARKLLASLVTNAPPRDREVEAARLRQRSLERFGKSPNAIRPSGARR